MRLRTFIGSSMSDAMRQVRQAMGEESIIISTLQDPDGKVRVTAALEQALDAAEPGPPAPRRDDRDGAELAGHALDYHGVPLHISARLLGVAAATGVGDPVMALGAALDEIYRFSPPPERMVDHATILIGPPGMGKTVTAAKLAARALMHDAPVTVISTDTERAAAVEQLAAFTKILELELKTALTPKELRFALRARGPDCPAIIDSAGVNPFDADEMAALKEFITASEAEPLLVLASGLDSVEAAEIADAFRPLGAKRLITTRIDQSRRLGSMLAAADHGRLMFGDIGISPRIADGLVPLNPLSLARLLLRDPAGPARPNLVSEASS